MTQQERSALGVITELVLKLNGTMEQMIANMASVQEHIANEHTPVTCPFAVSASDRIGALEASVQRLATDVRGLKDGLISRDSLAAVVTDVAALKEQRAQVVGGWKAVAWILTLVGGGSALGSWLTSVFGKPPVH